MGVASAWPLHVRRRRKRSRSISHLLMSSCIKLYDYAVYCTVSICSIIFLMNSDAIF